jgi:hypothetical protein
MTHQGTVLYIYYWRIIGKADGILKENILGREARGEVLCVRKEDI